MASPNTVMTMEPVREGRSELVNDAGKRMRHAQRIARLWSFGECSCSIEDVCEDFPPPAAGPDERVRLKGRGEGELRRSLRKSFLTRAFGFIFSASGARKAVRASLTYQGLADTMLRQPLRLNGTIAFGLGQTIGDGVDDIG